MKIKNWTLCIGVSSLLVAAALGLQGCSSDAISIGSGGGAAGASTSEAGAAGKAVTAGSGGAGVAGDASDGEAGGSSEPLTQAELCEKFCTDEFDICTGDLQQYDTLEDCAADCNQFARGTVGDTSGDTLDCRIYHLNAAATISTATHCPHTGATPTAACVDP